MEDVLVVQTLMGLSAARELNDSLRASVEKQRALADKVRPRQEHLHGANMAYARYRRQSSDLILLVLILRQRR